MNSRTDGRIDMFVMAKFAVAAFFIFYVTVRIFTLALVSDEWGHITADLTGDRGLVDLLVFSHVEAQVHFLQALLSLGFVRIFPEGQIVWAARMPSLIGLGLYLFSCWKITNRVSSRWLGLSGFLALCCNAFVLDYFGLARGYGLALGFAALSLFFFVESISREKACGAPRVWMILSVWAASFAVLCNMAFANFYAGIALVCMYSCGSFNFSGKSGIISSLRSFFVANGYLFANAALLFTFYLSRVLLLVRYNQLYFGGSDSFVRDTVGSLVKSSFYRRDIPDGAALIIAYMLAAFSVVMSVMLVFKAKEKKSAQLSTGVYFSAIVSIMALFNIAGFYLADVKFLIERAALAFFPVFILQVIFFIAEFTKFPGKLGYAVLLFCILLGIHGVNFKRTGDYCAYSQTPELLNDLRRIQEKTGQMMVLGVTDSTKYTLGWYAEKQAGLPESPKTKGNNGFMKQFQWLVIYSLDYAVPAGGQLHFFPETTHIVAQSYMDQSKIPCKTKLLKEYPYAKTRLYEVEK